MKAFLVTSGAEVDSVPHRRDHRVRMILARASDPKQALRLILATYCLEEPALATTRAVRQLALILHASTDPRTWTLGDDLETASRLDAHRRARRMTRARFLEVLLGEIRNTR